MEKKHLVLLTLESLHIPDSPPGSFSSVWHSVVVVSLNIASSQNFKSHGTNVYKEEQFLFRFSVSLFVINLFVLVSVSSV